MAHRDVVEALLRALDAHDLDAVTTLLTEDVEFRHPAAQLQGSGQVAQFFIGSLGAFPDGRHEVHRVAEQGDVFAVEGTWRGTHDAPMHTPAGEVPPTGRHAVAPFAVVGSMTAGRVSELHIYSDQLGLLAQLGLSPVGDPNAVA